MHRALLPLLAVTVLAACGSGDGSTPGPSSDFGAAARDATDSALMTLDDLPQFWTVGDPDDTNLDVELSPECDVFDTNVSLPGATATDAALPYNGTEARMATFITAAFQDEQTAITAFDGLGPLVDRCGPELLQAIEETARREAAELGFDLGPLGRVDVTIDDHEFVQLGDQSQALRVLVEVRVLGIGTDFTLDIIVVRAGRMMGTMTYSNFGKLDTVEEQNIARTMTGKLSDADAMLPEIAES